ncbi:hypothetical protein N0V83_007358 [Neocucurbitaria cava]|uniref:25S rRNA (uridine-N(3))-methyltransferase BMT5-like domain-containing protein n=1 Tax=Neocucurbitaria cava TaxID=798079 RepID=A0A9W9CK79_9PLEO|nr:hypothetical protein N0V83_007358 [Neocucurbitaria cava]
MTTTNSMSKTKTKRARRELKREGNRKIAAHHRKVAKAAEANTPKATPASSSKLPSAKKQKSGNAPDEKTQQTTPKPPPPTIQASQKHAVPFGAYEHILLVGEGDFSFTRSLAVEHGCANVTATSYDTEDEVREKYPTFEEIEKELKELSPPVPVYHGIDAGKLSGYKHLRCKRDEAENEGDGGEEGAGVGGGIEGWDTIVFMFPHTGGLSTDVNRQVRSNQALLVSFFKSCLDTPTPAKRLRILLQSQQQQAQQQTTKATPTPPLLHHKPAKKENKDREFLRMHGRIIVTLFESEPYTLWNIRDLARHAGLKVVESWKFDWAQYPGYHHVRTLGAMEGGWKGEDRSARMYVFEKIPLVPDSEEEKELQKMKKRERGGALVSQKKGFQEAVAGNKREREDQSGSEDESG